jgi:hypothetical protein
MKLLINDKEISQFLYTLIDHHDACNGIIHDQTELAEAILWIDARKDNPKFKDKIKIKITQAVTKDAENYKNKIVSTIEQRKKFYYEVIRKNLDFFIKTLGVDEVLEAYKNSKTDNFVKSVGLQLDPAATLIRRNSYSNFQDDCLLRNTTGNEQFLVSKIDNKLPFWFIDSGYTNFLEPNKKWHRLVKNHLHFEKQFNAPVDRLGMFKSFPQQWRTGGDKILVIEPGEFAASIFHIDITAWKLLIEQELKKYTDKKIVFREKAPKKKRSPLYKHLLDEDYYCVVSINSNAATEAIWAGVPAITLDKHITNSVTRSQISDINNLYKGSLAEWLAMLSYSQFTYKELIDGTAASLVKKYHA